MTEYSQKDLQTPEEILQELEKIEDVAVLADLYGVPDWKIRVKIKEGYSGKQLDDAWENWYTLDSM